MWERVKELEFLGHRVSVRGISPLSSKIEAVQRFEQPRTVKALQRFLGLVNFYRHLLPCIAATMRPLTNALAGAPWQLAWTEEMMSAFQPMKQRLAEATLLFHPMPGADLQINTDASSRVIAGGDPSESEGTATAPRVLQPPNDFRRIEIFGVRSQAPCRLLNDREVPPHVVRTYILHLHGSKATDKCVFEGS